MFYCIFSFFLHFPLLRRNYLIFLTSLFPGKVEKLQKLGVWIESEILLSFFSLFALQCLFVGKEEYRGLISCQCEQRRCVEVNYTG